MKTRLKLGLIVMILTAAMLVLGPAAYAVDFKISGQIYRAVLWADNGDSDDLLFVDNDNSSTRFRFTGSNDFDYNITMGITWEVEMQSNPSNVVDIGDNDDTGDVTFDERKIEWWMSTNFGKIYLGQGSTASDGTAEVDLSGTDVITYSSISDMAGGITFRDKDDSSIKLAAVGDVSSNFDGLSRRDRIRYDTPTWGGFNAAGSYLNGQSWDLAARFARQWDGFGKLAAAIGYTGADTQRFPYKQVDGSVSWLHGSGLNLTFSAGQRYDREGDADDSTSIYGKVGFKRGIHAVSLDYGKTDDLDENGDKFQTVALGYVISPWESIEFYGAYRWHALERDDIDDPDDISAVMIGGRVKF